MGSLGVDTAIDTDSSQVLGWKYPELGQTKGDHGNGASETHTH